MSDMDFSSKRCKTTSVRLSKLDIDRLTSLPDELLLQILSLLPTKDAVAMSGLSRKISCLLPVIATLDFDDSTVSHCVTHPFGIERFPTFVNFVDKNLLGHQLQHLTKFRLRLGSDFITRYHRRCHPYAIIGCDNRCLPAFKSVQIRSWISFPLTHSVLRELDLSIHVRLLPDDDGQLPPEIFVCQTLEVLKLDVNLGFNLVSNIHLPKLKTLHLHASLISEDALLTRLVSSCPLLEELTVKAWWNHVHFTNISSTSLRRLSLTMYKLQDADNTDLVVLHTPNLEYLFYCDNIALQYSVPNMLSLAKAEIDFTHFLKNETIEVSGQNVLNLITSLSSVQHLVLLGSCTQALGFVELKHQLPVFRNLKHLELGFSTYTFWNKVLFPIFNCTPVLETLSFPGGMMIGCEDISDDSQKITSLVKEERAFFSTTQAVPLCCRLHLKRIVIHYYFGKERELYLIQFFLRHALVLEELVVYANQSPLDLVEIEKTLKALPRTSKTCSIQVRMQQRKLY